MSDLIKVKICGKVCKGTSKAIELLSNEILDNVLETEAINLVEHREPTNKIFDHVGYLANRWEDESEYEDFKDYKSNIKKVVEDNGFHFVKLTKGFKLTISKDKDATVDTIINVKRGKITTEINGQRVLNRLAQ